jgi:RNA polymerase sigma-70 factor, ECF subfamily
MISELDERGAEMSAGRGVRNSGVVRAAKSRAAQEMESTGDGDDQLKDGGEDFATLVDKYAGVVYWLGHYMTGDSKDAQNVLQNTFLAVQSSITDLKQNESAAMRLARIAVDESFAALHARNISMSAWLSLEAEADGVFDPQGIADWSEDAENRFTRDELGKIVHEAVEGLTPFLRIVFLLRDVADLRAEEIADLFGLSVPRVKAQLLRSRLQLREHLNRYFTPDLKKKAQTA